MNRNRNRNRNVDYSVNGGPSMELMLAAERFVYRQPRSEDEEFLFDELYEGDFLDYCLESRDIAVTTSLHKVLLYLAGLEFSLYIYDDIDWIEDYTDFQKYAIEMFMYMYSEVPIEFYSDSEEVVMKARETYADRFHHGLNFIVDSAFAQLWSRKSFLCDFNILASERISQLTKLEYPMLERDGRLHRVNYFPKWLEHLIIKRESGCCHYCSTPVVIPSLINQAYDIDHVVPIAKGGSNDPTNLVLACMRCNNKKRANILLVPDTFAWPHRL